MVTRSVSATRLAALLGTALDSYPAYRGLADGVRLLITDGRVVDGTRLPSERELTGALGVSRTTVSRAYAELRERGYLRSRRGSGSVAALPGPARRRLVGPLTPGDQQEGQIDLTCAAPTAPPGTASAYAAALEDLPAYLSGTGYHPLGLPVLREVLAERFNRRGLPTDPDQIIVTAGALAGMAMVARTLLGPGDRVLMETPTYPNAIATMRRANVRPVGVPLDPAGWDTDGVAAALRQTAPKAAVLIPDFHNPTGALMPESQRVEVADALVRTRTTGIVDETLVDLALGSETVMPPPLATFDPRTITIGSASKSHWGGLRIGWVRAPMDQMGALTDARLTLDLGGPVLEQLVLTRLLTGADGIVEQHRQPLVEARSALTGALRERLPDWRFVVPAGGLALWCELPLPLSTALTAAAERDGVLLAAGPRFAVEGGLERFLRIPYTVPPELLRAAVDRIGTAWELAQRQRTATARRTPLVA